MGAAGSLASKPLKMSGFSGRFVEREGVACLENAQLSGFGVPSLKHLPSLAPFPFERVAERLLAGLKTAENGAGFLGALLKRKELHILKPLNLSGFGFLPLKTTSV